MPDITTSITQSITQPITGGGVPYASGTDLTVGLYAFYDFEEAVASNLLDQSGAGRDVTKSGGNPTATTGPDGSQAKKFVTGTIVRYTFGDTTTFSFDGSFTIAVFYKFEADNGFTNVITQKWGGAGQEFKLFLTTGDQFQFSVNTTGGEVMAALPVITYEDVWHSVVAVFEEGVGLTLYQDGVAGTPTATADAMVSTTARAMNVVDTDANPDNLDGELDNLAFWNRALTQEEITEFHNINGAIL